jgi:hypothetical protein
MLPALVQERDKLVAAATALRTHARGGNDAKQRAGNLMELRTNLMKLRQRGCCTAFWLCVLMQ